MGLELINKLMYIAGIVVSDGYIRDREVRIATSNISFAVQLCKILRDLGYKPRMDRGKRVYLIRVYSKELSLKLQKILEIKPGRKSHIVRIPRGLSIDELKSFIAGLIDGDGSVGRVSTGD